MGIGDVEKSTLNENVLSELRHAVMNPLTVLIGYAEVLAGRQDLPNEVTMLLQELVARARECGSAVERLFSLLSGGEAEAFRTSGLEKGTSQGGMRAKVLVVDDEVLIQRLITKVLGQEHEVVTVSTGEEALELLRKQSFDCIILDLNLRGVMGGEDLLKKIRREMPNLARRTLVVGGDSTQRLSEVSREYFLGGYLQKPFYPDALRHAVRSVLGKERGEA